MLFFPFLLGTLHSVSDMVFIMSVACLHRIHVRHGHGILAMCPYFLGSHSLLFSLPIPSLSLSLACSPPLFLPLPLFLSLTLSIQRNPLSIFAKIKLRLAPLESDHIRSTHSQLEFSQIPSSKIVKALPPFPGRIQSEFSDLSLLYSLYTPR